MLSLVLPTIAYAQNDLGGMDEINGRGGSVSEGEIRATILDILMNVLSFVALIAVIVIIIAGFYLIFSNGDEGNKDKAKKIIIYTIAGIVVIALASAAVAFVINVFD